jgi:hypothetical protein
VWSSGQASWLQIQRSGFHSRHYLIIWEVVGLERSPLSLVNTNEELLGGKSSGSGLEIREYGHRDPSCWPRSTLYPQKLALTSSTSGGCSVGKVRSLTQATEFLCVCVSSSMLAVGNWRLRREIPFMYSYIATYRPCSWQQTYDSCYWVTVLQTKVIL